MRTCKHVDNQTSTQTCKHTRVHKHAGVQAACKHARPVAKVTKEPCDMQLEELAAKYGNGLGSSS